MSEVGDRPRPRLSRRRDVDGLTRLDDRTPAPDRARTRRDTGEPGAQASRPAGVDGAGDDGEGPRVSDGGGGAAAARQLRGREADTEG